MTGSWPCGGCLHTSTGNDIFYRASTYTISGGGYAWLAFMSSYCRIVVNLGGTFTITKMRFRRFPFFSVVACESMVNHHFQGTGEFERGMRAIKVYVTDVDPTIAYGTNVTADQLLFNGEAPINPGGTAFADWQYLTVPTARTGKNAVIYITSNWTSLYVGARRIEFGVTL